MHTPSRLRGFALALAVASAAPALVGCGRWTTGMARRERGLVAHWKFDRKGGKRIRDSSGLGNHGTVYGARRIEGKEGRALLFDSPRAYVKIPSRKSLSLDRALSIEAWIRPQDLSKGSRTILSKHDEYALRIDNPEEGNKLSFFVHVGTPAVKWEPRVSSVTRPTLNRWQKVLAVWTGSELRLYIDGTLVSTQRRFGRPNPNPYPLMIGNWEFPSCHGIHFMGSIDEVKVYNYAKTP